MIICGSPWITVGISGLQKWCFLLSKGKKIFPNEHSLKVAVKFKRVSSVTGSKPPPLIRRSSFPAQFPEVRARQAPQRQQSQPSVPPSRRMSVDLAEDDSSPDRRRVRIIRRHWARWTYGTSEVQARFKRVNSVSRSSPFRTSWVYLSIQITVTTSLLSSFQD